MCCFQTHCFLSRKPAISMEAQRRHFMALLLSNNNQQPSCPHLQTCPPFPYTPASTCHQWGHHEWPLQHPRGPHCSNPSFLGWGGNYQHMIILFCLNYLPWKETVWRGGDVKECVQLRSLALILPRARKANLLRRKITSFSSLSSPTPRS